ncbi:hypothetical protein [Profundibacterium mesophilum]|uniref:Uncharacterized protein n=1 Tax=Profundibacterium mesophilum KAUST100406-0324 TaxID=1037889 RepID=A0A921NS98_9RHOB|nr:hypothetical protein [Profundibacterium mesophilum]KAF0674388.1 hypothetical protein PMES_03313 [Profundibacterium mesophilum KAUST100406-0324]
MSDDNNDKREREENAPKSVGPRQPKLPNGSESKPAPPPKKDK